MKAILWALVCFALGLPLKANSIVTNGSFETGTFSGWTVSSTSDHPWAIDTSTTGSGSGHGPESGTYFASTGCVGGQCIGSDSLSSTAFLYQDLTTVAGNSYNVDFYFASAGQPGQELLVTFGGTTLYDLVNLSGSGTSPYTEYTTTVIATGTTSRLEFQSRQDPSYNALDNISVTDLGPSGVPEPSSLALTLTGASCLLYFHRRVFSRQ